MMLFFQDSLPFVTSSMLTSQAVVFATAMAVSAGTVFLFELFREKHFPSSDINPNQDSPPDEKKILKSCLHSGSKKKKNKKRVQFAEDVKDSTSNGEMYRRENQRKSAEIWSCSCGNEVQKRSGKIPENRMALYSEMLKNRVHRMEYSY